ncbi:hypothetical protein SHKM778_76370 [Streptomyces sp. KM77-8]|uniref:STAS domain-containing protein n=1 Tax=Streptomyces haneummycinicus TaxID=3074435 RepID=A0AAT9HVU2_9ACTN
MFIGCRTDADRALLTPRGELVRGGARILAAKLTELPAGTARVDADMSGVSFMDTAGLEFLEVLREHGRRRSVPVTATRWTGQPRRVLELAGLDPTDPSCARLWGRRNACTCSRRRWSNCGRRSRPAR